VWDASARPSPKQRVVTAETLRRQRLVAENVRREADAIAKGWALRPLVTSRPVKRPEPREVRAAEQDELWAFSATDEGRVINKLLLEFSAPRDQLRLLRAHRNCCRGEPYAHEAWVRLLLELRQ
jgi:hypothetical protein